jgi:hypothetical protein
MGKGNNMKFANSARSAVPRADRRYRRVLTRIAVVAASFAVLAALPTLSASASASASAATTKPAAVTSAASSASLATPDGSTWALVYGWYPTQSACRDVGLKKYDIPDGIPFKCEEINRGDYFTWALYVFLVD